MNNKMVHQNRHQHLRRQFFGPPDSPPFQFPPPPTFTFPTPTFTLLDPTFVTGLPNPLETLTNGIPGGCMGCTVSTSDTTTSSTLTTSSTAESTTSSSTETTFSSTSSSSSSKTSLLATPSTVTTSSTISSVVSTTSSSVVTTPDPRPTPVRTTSIEYITSTGTFTHSVSASVSSRVPSASTTPHEVASTSKGVMIGGISAAVICAVGALAVIFYIIRRCKNRRTDDEFDPDAFRRQSNMILDGETSPRPWNSTDSANPRPPTMIERHLGNQSPAAFPQYGQPGQYRQPPSPGPFSAYAPAAPGQPYAPGQFVSPPPTATSAVPFFAAQAYDGQAQMLPSPTASAVGHYDSAYDDRGELVRRPSAAHTLARQPSAPRSLTRQPSPPLVVPPVPSVCSPVPVVIAPPVPAKHELADPHYIDLDRSSVTPFQAAQYAEISRKLADPATYGPSTLRIVNQTSADNSPAATPMSAGFVHTLDGTAPTQLEPLAESLPESENGHDPQMRRALTPQESPFADAATPTKEETQDVAAAPMEDVELEAPKPAFAARERIMSVPPSLPERRYTPVKLSMSDFVIPTADSAAPQVNKAPVPAPAPVAERKRPDTVYSAVYDPEDAYGGM